MKNKKSDKEGKIKKIDFKLNNEQKEKQTSLEQDEDNLENDYDPKLDPEPIVIFDCELDSIEELKAVDLLYLIDTTASMNCYLKGIKNFVRKMTWDIEKCLSKFILDEIDVLKVGIVTYKDHDDEDNTYLTNIKIDLTGNLKEVNSIILGLDCGGGKDEPEAVLDGLNTAVNNISWRNESIKFIFHILDAPPHGKKYNNIEIDKYENCPKNIDIDQIFVEMRNKNINYSIIKLNDSIELMIQEFQKKINLKILTPTIYYDKSKIMSQDLN